MVSISERGLQLTIDGYTVTSIEPMHLDLFAMADGFTGWEQMREWFRDTHGLPFSGVLIRWQNV
jgi:hypothetical protein